MYYSDLTDICFDSTLDPISLQDFLETGLNTASIDHIRGENTFDCTGYRNFSLYSFDVSIKQNTVTFKQTSGDEDAYVQSILYLGYILKIEKNPPRIYVCHETRDTRDWDMNRIDQFMTMLKDPLQVTHALMLIGMFISNEQKKYLFLDYGIQLIFAISRLELTPVSLMIFAEFIHIPNSNMAIVHYLIPLLHFTIDQHYTRETMRVLHAICLRDPTLVPFLNLIKSETKTRDKTISTLASEIMQITKSKSHVLI
jgi:hypothetical protein